MILQSHIFIKIIAMFPVLNHRVSLEMGTISNLRTSELTKRLVFEIQRFYGCLVNNLMFKYKEVHAATAEVIGLLMKQAADVQKVSLFDDVCPFPKSSTFLT